MAVRVRVQVREAVKVTLARVDLALVRKSRDWQSRVCFPPRPKTHGGRSAVEVSSGTANLCGLQSMLGLDVSIQVYNSLLLHHDYYKR